MLVASYAAPRAPCVLRGLAFLVLIHVVSQLNACYPFFCQAAPACTTQMTLSALVCSLPVDPSSPTFYSLLEITLSPGTPLMPLNVLFSYQTSMILHCCTPMETPLVQIDKSAQQCKCCAFLTAPFFCLGVSILFVFCFDFLPPLPPHARPSYWDFCFSRL